MGHASDVSQASVGVAVSAEEVTVNGSGSKPVEPTDKPAGDISVQPDLWADAGYHAAVVDLVGVLAYGELSAFERLAADAALAPTVGDKAELSGMAVAEYRHFVQLRARLVELGADPEEAMQPFRDGVDGFHDSTAPADWLEGLVKAYVGDGIGADFYREVAAFLDPDSRALVLDVCADTGHSQFAVDRVRAAIEADPRVAGRLALWGRRLVGEMLSQAQRVAAERDALVALIVGGMGPSDQPSMDLTALSKMFTRLTDNHTRRMQSLGPVGIAPALTQSGGPTARNSGPQAHLPMPQTGVSTPGLRAPS